MVTHAILMIKTFWKGSEKKYVAVQQACQLTVSKHKNIRARLTGVIGRVIKRKTVSVKATEPQKIGGIASRFIFFEK